MWTKARITVYLTVLLGGIGALLASLGLATYDPVAQTIDPNPISIPVVVGIVAPLLATGLAAIAAMLGWGRKG